MVESIHFVASFDDLISMPFLGEINAMCFQRELRGDFSEIVEKVDLDGNMTEIAEEELHELPLSVQGQLAREILLNDLKVLKAHGAAPILNVIRHYERDEAYPFFPTDVYSFHVDCSPVPTDTYLCTYHGESSEILPNSQAVQKILIPEIRNELKKRYDGSEESFESFLVENFFDLHYQALPNSKPVNLGIGNMWKLAIKHPESKTIPCIHRAPDAENRLLLIC